jgi:hypothetical protein
VTAAAAERYHTEDSLPAARVALADYGRAVPFTSLRCGGDSALRAAAEQQPAVRHGGGDDGSKDGGGAAAAAGGGGAADGAADAGSQAGDSTGKSGDGGGAAVPYNADGPLVLGDPGLRPPEVGE